MMKLLRIALMALVLVALLVPTIGLGDGMLLPLERKISAGTTTVTYGGQTLRFTTPVALLLKIDPESETRYRLTVSIYPGTPPPPSPTMTSESTLNIYWTDFDTEVYDGDVPIADPWTGCLNTEGGFVER
jgi:hypothetical protein